MHDERPVIFFDDRSLFIYILYIFSDVLNERVDKERTRIIDDFAEEWCVELEAVEYVIETYDVTKDPDDKQDNQDALREASHVKEYRKKYPAVSGLKYWPNLTTALRELYVEKLQKLMERL